MKTHNEIQQLRFRLGEAMSKATLTQMGVSQATGIPQPILSHFICGKRGLSGEYALRMNRYLLETIPHPGGPRP